MKYPIGTVAYMGGVMAVPEEFTWAWTQMVQFNNEALCGPDQYVHIDRSTTSYHASARNILAQRFLGDWLFMTDTDHSFDPDIVARMVQLTKRWDVDVLTAVYRFKVHPYLPNLYQWDDSTNGFRHIAELDWSQPLSRIDCAGGGCLLVRRNVFERIDRELGEEPFEIMKSPNDRRHFSEDFSFFMRLRRLGIQPYCSPMIESRHLRMHQVTHQDFDRSAVSMQPRMKIVTSTVPMECIPTGGSL